MTLVRYQVTILKQGGCDEIVVVTGHRSEDIQAELFDLEVSFVENPDYQSGRVSSVKEGIKSSSVDTNSFVLLATNIFFASSTISAMNCLGSLLYELLLFGNVTF